MRYLLFFLSVSCVMEGHPSLPAPERGWECVHEDVGLPAFLYTCQNLNKPITCVFHAGSVACVVNPGA